MENYEWIAVDKNSYIRIKDIKSLYYWSKEDSGNYNLYAITYDDKTYRISADRCEAEIICFMMQYFPYIDFDIWSDLKKIEYATRNKAPLDTTPKPQ